MAVRTTNIVNPADALKAAKTLLGGCRAKEAVEWTTKAAAGWLRRRPESAVSLSPEELAKPEDLPDWAAKAANEGKTLEKFVLDTVGADMLRHIGHFLIDLEKTIKKDGLDQNLKTEAQKTLSGLDRTSVEQAYDLANAWFAKATRDGGKGAAPAPAQTGGQRDRVDLAGGSAWVRLYDSELKAVGHQLRNCLARGFYGDEVRRGTQAIWALFEGGDSVCAIRFQGSGPDFRQAQGGMVNWRYGEHQGLRDAEESRWIAPMAELCRAFIGPSATVAEIGLFSGKLLSEIPPTAASGNAEARFMENASADGGTLVVTAVSGVLNTQHGRGGGRISFSVAGAKGSRNLDWTNHANFSLDGLRAVAGAFNAEGIEPTFDPRYAGHLELPFVKTAAGWTAAPDAGRHLVSTVDPDDRTIDAHAEGKRFWAVRDGLCTPLFVKERNYNGGREKLVLTQKIGDPQALLEICRAADPTCADISRTMTSDLYHAVRIQNSCGGARSEALGVWGDAPVPTAKGWMAFEDALAACAPLKAGSSVVRTLSIPFTKGSYYEPDAPVVLHVVDTPRGRYRMTESAGMLRTEFSRGSYRNRQDDRAWSVGLAEAVAAAEAALGKSLHAEDRPLPEELCRDAGGKTIVYRHDKAKIATPEGDVAVGVNGRRYVFDAEGVLTLSCRLSRNTVTALRMHVGDSERIAKMAVRMSAAGGWLFGEEIAPHLKAIGHCLISGIPTPLSRHYHEVVEAVLADGRKVFLAPSADRIWYCPVDDPRAWVLGSDDAVRVHVGKERRIVADTTGNNEAHPEMRALLPLLAGEARMPLDPKTLYHYGIVPVDGGAIGAYAALDDKHPLSCGRLDVAAGTWRKGDVAWSWSLESKGTTRADWTPHSLSIVDSSLVLEEPENLRDAVKALLEALSVLPTPK